MKFTGKQIRIELLNGEKFVYRGSDYILKIEDYGDYHAVMVYSSISKTRRFYRNSDEIESVVEDSYSQEYLK